MSALALWALPVAAFALLGVVVFFGERSKRRSRRRMTELNALYWHDLSASLGATPDEALDHLRRALDGERGES